MSIASQIEDYADGLSDAYAMVAQRGGTMPAQKNMNNLTTAIATIPSGGIPAQPTLTSATYSNGVITLTGSNFGSAPVVKMFNRKYDRYDAITPITSSANSATVPVGTSDYGYYSRVVKIENGGFESDVKFVYADYESLGANGYDIVAWCYTTQPNKVPLSPYSMTVANSASGSIQVNYVWTSPRTFAYTCTEISTGTSTSVTSPAIRGLEINPSLTNEFSNINGPLSNLRALDQPMGFANVTEFGQPGGSGPSFSANTSFNSPIDVSNITKFGYGFMRYNSAFNQPISFNSNVTLFGDMFMAYCCSFNQPLTLPVGDANTYIQSQGNFMRECWAYAYPLTFDHWNISSTSYFLYDTMNLPCINVISSTLSGTIGTSVVSVLNSAANCPAYREGITVNGDSAASTWLASLPNMSSGSAYRKLIQGTITS